MAVVVNSRTLSVEAWSSRYQPSGRWLALGTLNHSLVALSVLSIVKGMRSIVKDQLVLNALSLSFRNNLEAKEERIDTFQSLDD